jgi:His/Glu/Gln/Arg/opine family amino acid ABC transporter permease subunit
MYQLHFEALVPYAPLFLRGLYVTLYLSIAAMAVGIVCGLLFALARLSPLLILHIFARILIDFIRGVPLLVLLIFIYYGVSIFFDIDIPAIAAAIGGLGRAGILEVDKGQIEAARSLGMSGVRVFRRVVLPHAFRAVLPPVTNSFISIFKDSSLVSVLAISELTRAGQEVVIATFRAFEAYAVVALIYYLIATILSFLSSGVEKWVRRGQ